MLEEIAKIGLFFAQPSVWATVGVVGFCAINQQIVGRTLYLVLFTMIYNTFLKSIWQEPLPPPMEGWAFPSGHMHSAIVFWGWLAVEYRRLGFSAIIFFILCLAGYGVVYHGYHYPRDVLGAVGFGSLSIVIYSLLQRLTIFKDQPYRLGFLLSLLSILFISLTPVIGRKPHIWQGLGGLLGFTLGWMLLSLQKPRSYNFFQRIAALLLTAVGSALLVLGFKQLPLTVPLSVFMQFFAVGVWLGVCQLLVGTKQKQSRQYNFARLR